MRSIHLGASCYERNKVRSGIAMPIALLREIRVNFWVCTRVVTL